jgi:hypothetical protein
MGSSIIIGNNNIQGQNIVIRDGIVIVDGKKIELPPESDKDIHIKAENIQSLRIDTCKTVTIEGNTGAIDVGQGGVFVKGLVKGSVKVNQGNVDCENIDGDVTVNMGTIKTRRG